MTKTPLSDAALFRDYPRWVEHTYTRLVVGKESYGDHSFTTPVKDGIEEIQAELEDQANWAFIQWCKLERIKENLK